MWAWMATTAYLWNAGFQQFAATHRGFHADWSTAGFALPVLVLFILASAAQAFDSHTSRRVLAALSLFLVHVFVNNLTTLAAWAMLDLGFSVVTPQSMFVEIAVAAGSAAPVVASTLPANMPLTAALVLFPLRNAPPERLTVYLPLMVVLLWSALAYAGFCLG